MSKKNIILLSDFEFDDNGSPMTGYTHIASDLGRELASQHNIIGMGISYRRNEYWLPFGISNIPLGGFTAAVHGINNSIPDGIDSVIVCLDIPMQIRIFDNLKKPDTMKWLGIFAVEGDPLLFEWAQGISKFTKNYAISRFGVEECKKSYLSNVKYYSVPVNREVYKPREEGEKEKLKIEHGLKDKKVVFCNADSNERKNISALIEAFRLLVNEDKSYHLVLLTRIKSPVGWNYTDFIGELKLQSNITLLDRGLSEKQIRDLIALSDIYIQPSCAEGLNRPTLEAQSVGTPVLVTDCTALSEHINNNKGYGLTADFVYRGPFGNARRYYVFPSTIAERIKEVIDKNDPEMINNAMNYIDQRNIEFTESVQSILGDISNE